MKTVITNTKPTAPIKGVTTTTANNDKIFIVFDEADQVSAGFYERLIKLGLTTRSQARPYAVAWASVKYNTLTIAGQQGETLPQNSAAIKAVGRVLARCFEEAGATAKTNKAVEPKIYTALQISTRDKFMRLFGLGTPLQRARLAQAMLTQYMREAT